MASFSSPGNNCIFKTVSLAAGEQFNLPPGAELLGSSNVNAITSTCPIPKLEDQAHYTIYHAFSAQGDVDGHSAFMQGSDVYVQLGILGHELGLGTYTFSTTDVVNALTSVGLNGIVTITALNTNQWPTSPGWPTGPSRYGQFLEFLTLPSIAATMYLKMSGGMTDGAQSFYAQPY